MNLDKLGNLQSMLLESTPVSNFSSPTTLGFEGEANARENRALTTVSASLSLLGTSFIIGTFIAWKDFRSTSRRILVYISISDFFIAGGNLFGVWQPRADFTVCKSQSFVTTCASLCSFFWTTFLAIFMYTVVVKKQANKAGTMLKFYHIIGWGVPLIITGTALGLGKLGNDNDVYSAGWCWIDSKLSTNDKYLWLLISGKAWEVTAYFVSSTFYLMLKSHIRKEVSCGTLTSDSFSVGDSDRHLHRGLWSGVGVGGVIPRLQQRGPVMSQAELKTAILFLFRFSFK